MSDKKLICSVKFNYDEINFITLCGKTFNIKEIGSISSESNSSKIQVHILGKSYQIDERTHEYLLCFLAPLPNTEINNED